MLGLLYIVLIDKHEDIYGVDIEVRGIFDDESKKDKAIEMAIEEGYKPRVLCLVKNDHCIVNICRYVDSECLKTQEDKTRQEENVFYKEITIPYRNNELILNYVS